MSSPRSAAGEIYAGLPAQNIEFPQGKVCESNAPRRLRRPAYRQNQRLLFGSERVRNVRTEQYEVSFLLQCNLAVREQQHEVPADENVERLDRITRSPFISRFAFGVGVPL